MLSQEIKGQIQEDIANHKIVLFMKGSKAFPMCGFSSTVVDILRGYTIDFHCVNVLNDPDLRKGIKEFSQWPTIPQLYVNGHFIGGCDIISELHEKKELEELFKEKTH